jgi:hypothetical protein
MSRPKKQALTADELRELMPAGLAEAGRTRPSLPVTYFAEDFSILTPHKQPRRLRIRRMKIRVLH